MKDYRQLQVWERSHRLTVTLYRVSARFPAEERYGLTSQIRRAAASIPANIAEGCGRDGDAELARFCRIASGSASELDYHLLLAKELGLLGDNSYRDLANEMGELRRMITTFLKKLTASSQPLNANS